VSTEEPAATAASIGGTPRASRELPAPATRLLDSIGQAVIVADRAGSILFWNAAAEVIYGWGEAEVVGRDIVAVMATEGSAGQGAQLLARLHAGQSWQGELPVSGPAGAGRTALVTANPVLADNGDLVAVIAVACDVTVMRQTTQALAGSQRRFEALIEGSGDLFAVTDTDGVIIFVAGPVDSLVGLGAAALVGTSLFGLMRSGDRERGQALWGQRAATTIPMPAEDFWTRRADGTWLCLSLLVSNLLDDPAVAGIVVTGRDVTVRKYLEQARRSTSRASAALVQASNEDDLFSEICRVVVSDVAYHLAWIGLADPTRPLGLRLAGVADRGGGYFDALEALAEVGPYRGPLAITLETHEVCIVQDVTALPENMPWRRLALDYGYRSMIALPLPFGEGDYGVLAIHSGQPDVFTDDAVTMLSELAGAVAYGVDALRIRAQRADYRARFEGGLEAAVQAITTAAELRDPYTAGHQRQVAELATAIGTQLALDADLVTGIGVAATIHDIGKLAVPAEILSRPGRLSEVEFALIKQHSQGGHDIVAGIDFPWPVAQIILQHHERLDGSGYPRGMRGEEISIGSRILAVADTVEAMQAHRPYRAGLGLAAALHEIDAHRGTLFDPAVVDACTSLFAGGFHFTV
jgi:PAS domain S-box-containing protein